MNKTGNPIVDLSFQFALDIITFVELLEQERKFIVANQLLKSGTSIGANVREAQNGESKLDFIHKLKIAAKEADETEYWLLLCQSSENYPFNTQLLEDIKVLQKIINKIIGTAKSKQYD
ncbi:MAG: four helix bundle protein [Prevotella sp.]|jgi:four helix bundle protein|nr:four helix bundle protein [Prevotella sp.]